MPNYLETNVPIREGTGYRFYLKLYYRKHPRKYTKRPPVIEVLHVWLYVDVLGKTVQMRLGELSQYGVILDVAKLQKIIEYNE